MNLLAHGRCLRGFCGAGLVVAGTFESPASADLRSEASHCEGWRSGTCCEGVSPTTPLSSEVPRSEEES